MAVTPVGNPYVESSDLVANYPGASEALAERIDIVGVNPFANAAARATAIPSPVEGQMASLNNDDKVYRYDGAAWVAVGVDPGITLITSSTFSAVSSVSVNNCFTSDYTNYRLIFNVSHGTNNTKLMRLRASGTDNTDSTYNWAGYYLRTDASAAGNIRSSAQTSWVLITASVSQSYRGVMDIIAPALSQVTTATGTANTKETDGGKYVWQSGGSFENTNSFDGFTFTTGGGTISGTIRVYGYKD